MEKNQKIIILSILTVLLICTCGAIVYLVRMENGKKDNSNLKPEQNKVVANEEKIDEDIKENEEIDTDNEIILNVEKEEINSENTEVIENSTTNESNSTTTTNSNSSTSTNTTVTTNSSSSSKTNNTNSASKTQSNSTTTNASAPTTTVKNEVKLVGTESKTEVTDTTTKYGVVINTNTTTVYEVYSDGSQKVKSTNSWKEFDSSNYSATTAELLDEARSARSKNAGMISQVLANTNSYRAEANENLVAGINNRTDLVLDEQLCLAANVRAVEMAYSKKFSHTRPNGSSCFSILNEMGIANYGAGENIANGQPSAASVSQAWKNSSGHYENMITPGFTRIGIGVYRLENGAYYWVQLFA